MNREIGGIVITLLNGGEIMDILTMIYIWQFWSKKNIEKIIEYQLKKTNKMNREENNLFSFDYYLSENGWVLNGRIWRKHNKTIKLISNNSSEIDYLMIALNLNDKVKHKHIVTCEIPNTWEEAEIIFQKCRLNYFNYYQNDTENIY